MNIVYMDIVLHLFFNQGYANHDEFQLEKKSRNKVGGMGLFRIQTSRVGPGFTPPQIRPNTTEPPNFTTIQSVSWRIMPVGKWLVRIGLWDPFLTIASINAL